MTDHQDDHAPPERYDPGEREQVEREISERQRRIDFDAAVTWAKNRQAAARQADTVTKDYAPARRTEAPTPAPAEMSAAWTRYIKEQVARGERAVLRVVAAAIIDEERARQAVERDLAALRAELDQVRAELAELRGTKRLRAVPSSDPGSMIA
jgi:hypothetical protein